jgi:hypothetical protein
MGTTGPVQYAFETGRVPSIVRALLLAEVLQNIVACSALYVTALGRTVA